MIMFLADVKAETVYLDAAARMCGNLCTYAAQTL